MKGLLAKYAVLLTMLFTLACGDRPAEEPSEEEEGSAEEIEIPEEPTYHRDIQPLMAKHCTGCHVDDAIAPFPLDSYEDVRLRASISLSTMSTGAMPPWPPADDCGNFQGHRGMSDAEIETFSRWVAQDRVEGNPEDSPDPSERESDILEEPADLTVDWGFEYKPEPPGDGHDDYRCFVVDPELEEDRYVSAVNTRPGNPLLAHHMIAYIAPESTFDEISELESEDDRPGYTCLGSPRYEGAQMVAGWVPGITPLPLKDGHGVRVPAGSKLVIQMHYSTLNDDQGTDQTEVDFYFVDEEQHPEPRSIIIVRLAQLELFIEAGDPEAVVSVESPLITQSVKLHGVVPHMHMLGTRIRAEASTPEGDICLIDVPRWDFHWQGLYLYEEPILLKRPFRTSVRCEYDNSPSNQPDGMTPRDIYWGDESSDEMCLTMFIIERPEGL